MSERLPKHLHDVPHAPNMGKANFGPLIQRLSDELAKY
jgi:hypothetical protein